MNAEIIDLVGEFFWYLAFLAPFLAVTIFWNLISGKKIYKILFGFFTGLIFSAICLFISVAIATRNGLGS
ncbi:hypothetical protein [Flavobacterium selenitireducens]|uniref:hypothetical protein n=1 Tax=Flavobacterium selenitireducens TaxID=2722704 RepID=UPI00168A8A04|nr:hypothetical protein [Flavobacterium selenitireducens]MBD3581573.1 hypothetical protein [Flavobacterium selenitireducens]MBD3584081.1 hypothetical protein [Flavobacterium selenitireducens]MBD3584094.1 hypothetical protein [Flavobacterium selenitireducens]